MISINDVIDVYKDKEQEYGMKHGATKKNYRRMAICLNCWYFPNLNEIFEKFLRFELVDSFF